MKSFTTEQSVALLASEQHIAILKYKKKLVGG
ncbi:hypothetical protein LM5923_2138 [Listeria monocytogenes 08-5923]|nr:hypothetical protein LM5578_2187 [Listeria monocytogenes 08-5578]ADB71979.1 hypothetical protein LM5923_2138 [Listeria monocytogenes 08-5923]ASG97644.1 hypothetical protein N883_2194 [Listeria monocytogenes serotype 1/2a str. 01-5252]ASH85231.1 hypothetical protein N882_2181 [Listeria monocytogenes serotype 1/2a str. 01-1468]